MCKNLVWMYPKFVKMAGFSLHLEVDAKQASLRCSSGAPRWGKIGTWTIGSIIVCIVLYHFVSIIYQYWILIGYFLDQMPFGSNMSKAISFFWFGPGETKITSSKRNADASEAATMAWHPAAEHHCIGPSSRKDHFIHWITRRHQKPTGENFS